MTDITQQTRLLAELTSLAERFHNLGSGYRLAGERHRAMAADKVAITCFHASEALTEALRGLKEAKPMPERVTKLATLADGRPAYARSAGL